MVISYTPTGTVAIKTKTESIELGNGATIGSFVVPGPGEYDVAGILCEGKALSSSTAYFLRSEDLVIMYVSHLDTEASKLDDASATHILVVDVRSDDQPEALKPLIKAVEPSYVIITGAGATAAFGAALGIPAAEGEPLKLTRAGLPLEGTFLLNRA